MTATEQDLFAPVRMGKLHAARLENSPRLQRLNDFLSDGQWRSTREIIYGAEIMAVNSAVSELRANGIEIECKPGGRHGIYNYRKPLC